MTEQEKKDAIVQKISNIEFWSTAGNDNNALQREVMHRYRDFLHQDLKNSEIAQGNRGFVVGYLTEAKDVPPPEGEEGLLYNLEVSVVWGGDVGYPIARDVPVEDSTLRKIEAYFPAFKVFIGTFFLDDQGDRMDVVLATRHMEVLALNAPHISDNMKDFGSVFVLSFMYTLQHDLSDDYPPQYIYKLARDKAVDMDTQLQRMVPHVYKTTPGWIIIQTKALSGRVIAVHEYILFDNQFGKVEGKVTKEQAEAVADHVLQRYGNSLKIGHDDECEIHVDALVIPTDEVTKDA